MGDTIEVEITLGSNVVSIRAQQELNPACSARALGRQGVSGDKATAVVFQVNPGVDLDQLIQRLKLAIQRQLVNQLVLVSMEIEDCFWILFPTNHMAKKFLGWLKGINLDSQKRLIIIGFCCQPGKILENIKLFKKFSSVPVEGE